LAIRSRPDAPALRHGPFAALARHGLYARVFAVNALILLVAFALLVFTPVTVHATPTRREILVLLAGLGIMLIANAVLLRLSLAPLERLADVMRTVDVLSPGVRLDPHGSDEVASVIRTFNATIDRLEEERRSSMRRVLTAQEAERTRIAQEIHDQIGQNLTAVVLELMQVRDRVPEEADVLADAQELARESLEELGRISYRLRPAELEDLGLARALASLCADVARRASIEVAVDVERDLPRLDREAELAVYRVTQESLTNAVRHARCSRVDVHLAAAGDGLELKVRDNGIGLHGHAGAGLRGMRERALAVGATLRTRSAPGAGVEITLRVPVVEAEPR
jgi:two-component system sensor histidine kinase UhpB